MPVAPVTAALCGLVSAALALQDAPQGVTVDAVLAAVNGQAITRGDVESAYQRLETPLTRGEVLRLLVREKLLELAAREAAVQIPDDRLAQALAERIRAMGGPEAYAERLRAFGRTQEEDRQEVRKALIAAEFIDRSLGRVAGSPLLRPHLAQMTRVTPAEVQAYFREHREQFRTDDRLEIGRLLVTKSHFATLDEARNQAELIRKQALTIYSGRLAEAVRPEDKATYGTLAVLESQEEGLLPEIRAYLETSPVGVLSPVLETSGAFLVVVKTAETRGRLLEFAEVQDAVFRILAELKGRAARERLIRELLEAGEVWPADLFTPREAERSAAPGAGGAPEQEKRTDGSGQADGSAGRRGPRWAVAPGAAET